MGLFHRLRQRWAGNETKVWNFGAKDSQDFSISEVNPRKAKLLMKSFLFGGRCPSNLCSDACVGMGMLVGTEGVLHLLECSCDASKLVITLQLLAVDAREK